MINAILACDDNGGISKNGTLPWPKNSNDLKWFKSSTIENIVVMGRTTWEDPCMPKPLPKRRNVVVTHKELLNVETANGDVPDILKRLEKDDPTNVVWVIGGADILNQALPVIQNFHLSRIFGSYNCDKFIPINQILEKFHQIYKRKFETVSTEIWTRND